MSPRTPRRARRGFTLVELLVSTTIVALVLGMAMTAFLGQNRSLVAMDMSRVASESARDAMMNLEGALRMAGWGVDPRYVIDTLYQCSTGAPCHDKTDGPDELVFVARNPRYRWRDNGVAGCADAAGCFDGYAWRLSGVDLASSPHTVRVQTVPQGQVLEQGRVVVATCAGGQSPVMLRLKTRVDASLAALTNVGLEPDTTNAPPYNDPLGLKACHGQAGASLFLVDRYRYFVWTPAGTTTPWLTLDPGVDTDGDGSLPPADTDDLLPLAKNVVDLQVAYVMLQGTGAAPDTNANWLVGDDRGTTAAENLLANTATPAPLYDTSATDPSRFTLHPANVRGVRVTLTLRSSTQDASKGPGWTGDVVKGAENRAGNLSGGNLRRFVYSTDVTLRNMDSKSPFVF